MDMQSFVLHVYTRISVTFVKKIFFQKWTFCWFVLHVYTFKDFGYFSRCFLLLEMDMQVFFFTCSTCSRISVTCLDCFVFQRWTYSCLFYFISVTFCFGQLKSCISLMSEFVLPLLGTVGRTHVDFAYAVSFWSCFITSVNVCFVALFLLHSSILCQSACTAVCLASFCSLSARVSWAQVLLICIYFFE